MKISLLKKIIAVSLALTTLMLAGCSKDEPVNEENPSENISQNVDESESTSKETESSDKEETTENNSQDQAEADDIMGMEESFPTVMRETIDLKKADLTKYGLTKNNDISVPYPTSLGCVYVVRDYGKDEEQTYLFVTTKDKVMYLNTGFASCGQIPVEKAHSLTTGDLDGKKGEEILLLANTGGNGGAGVFCHGIYKIDNGKIVEMKISDEAPFEVTLEAPYTVVFKNKKLNYEKKVVCDTDYENLFDDKGNPVVKEYDGDFYAPHEAGIFTDEDEKATVYFTNWSRLSKSVDEETVESVVEYTYDSKTNQFVINYARVDVYVPDDIEEIYGSYDEYLAMCAYTNGYTYYDINKDGVDEFITHTGTCEANRLYRVYTFTDGKMICAGAFGGWHGTLYAKGKSLTVVSNGATENGTYVTAVTYELVDNKLVEKDVFEKEFTDDAEWEKYFDDLEKELEVGNIYYK